MIVKTGLIGYGMGGRVFHAPCITSVPGLELKMIRETRQENIETARERYPQAQIVSTSEAIIHSPEIDLVVIAVPNKFHHELAMDALEAGKHVVVEKPFTVTTAQADELIGLAKQKERVLSVFQNRRWDSDFLTVRKVIQNGRMGHLVEYEAHYDRFRNTLRPGTWKEGGDQGTGLLYDLGSHLIDQALVLFGRPEAVTAFMRKQREGTRIVDNFELLLHYAGLKVTLKSSMLVKAPLPKYILLGREGAFVKYGLDVQEEALNKGEHPGNHKDWGREPDSLWGTLTLDGQGRDMVEQVESERGRYPAFYENVHLAIIQGAPLAVSASQARDTIRVIELAQASDREQRTVKFD